VKKEQTEYLQNVSHQLVAPLNAIKWHIENLTAGRLTSEDRVRKVLRSIYSQSTLAVHLAKNFALMSNLEADHALSALREPLEPIDLSRLMVNLADDFQPLGWDKALSITVVDHPLKAAPQVLAIRPLISQVFSNIIENAVKYSDRGTEISISGIHNLKEGTVSVSVTNKGIPLPAAEEVERVFERGYRSPGARNLYPAGTGFGMYIAKKIVDIHEGTIEAKNADVGRVTFTVTLSVAKLKGKARQRDAKDGTNSR
jgi:signal transduction histidine kinase